MDSYRCGLFTSMEPTTQSCLQQCADPAFACVHYTSRLKKNYSANISPSKNKIIVGSFYRRVYVCKRVYIVNYIFSALPVFI